MALTFFGRGKNGSQGGSGGGSDMGPAKYARIQEVRAYWEALREGDMLPRRDQIDPRGMAGALEQVFLIERIGRGQARIRLAGMHLNDLMGMEVRGMPLSALFEPTARARLSEGLETVFAGPAVLDIWLEGERGVGRPALSGRMIVLPVSGSKAEPGLALGCLDTDGGLGRAPRRFAITGLVREPIRPEAPAPRPEIAHEFAEPAAVFAPRPPRGKPMLRLVTSNERN